MGIRPVLLAMGALALSGCASSDYGYGYCYDAYQGPLGYYYGPFEPRPACATTAALPAYYLGLHEAGYRGPYVSGPYASDPEATPAAVR